MSVPANTQSHLFEHDHKPLFLAPATGRRFQIESGMTGYRGEVSADAAGIIVTLFALSHFARRYDSALLAEGYHRLGAYSVGHAESAAIFAAIG